MLASGFRRGNNRRTRPGPPFSSDGARPLVKIKMPFQLPPSELLRSFAVKVPKSYCPYCGQECIATAGQAAPTAGDVTICIECAGICVFDEALALRKPNDAETADFAGDEDIQKMVAMVPALKAEKRKRGLK